MAQEPEMQAALHAAGATAALVRVAQTADPCSGAAQIACGVLELLAGTAQLRVALHDAGATTALVRLAQTVDPSSKAALSPKELC